MVPEEMYANEQGTPMERVLLLALRDKYAHERRERESAKQTLLAMGRDPRTGRRRHRGMRHVAAIGNDGRPPKKRVKNTFSKAEAGTIGNYVGVCRWDNSYITKACYRKKLW